MSEEKGFYKRFKDVKQLYDYLGNQAEFATVTLLVDFICDETYILKHNNKPIDTQKLAELLNIPYNTLRRNMGSLQSKNIIYRKYNSNDVRIICLNQSVYRLFCRKMYNSRNTQDVAHWKVEVKQRDEYTCQCCGSTNNLEVHHIEPYSRFPYLRTDINNGITLCENCHSAMILGGFHQIYGTRNNTLDQLQEYLDDKRTSLGLPLVDLDEIIYRKN